MVSSTAVASVLVLVIGFIATVILMGDRESGMKQRNRVSTPMFGGGSINREGPWPKCLGMDGTKCKTMIESYAKDVRGNTFLVHEGDMVTMDFRTDRVRIFIDDDSIVTKVPERG